VESRSEYSIGDEQKTTLALRCTEPAEVSEVEGNKEQQTKNNNKSVPSV
jgi:hypothetical protein